MTRDEFLRPADVEQEYGISVDTLSTWRLRTRREPQPVGPAWVPMGPRRIAYRRSVLDAWVESQAARAAS